MGSFTPSGKSHINFILASSLEVMFSAICSSLCLKSWVTARQRIIHGPTEIWNFSSSDPLALTSERSERASYRDATRVVELFCLLLATSDHIQMKILKSPMIFRT